MDLDIYRDDEEEPLMACKQDVKSERVQLIQN